MTKILFLYTVLLFALLLSSAEAQILDLDTGDNAGMSPVMDDLNIENSININSLYTVEHFNNTHGSLRSFEHVIGNGELNTASFEINAAAAWNATAVLSKYIPWSEWLAISVQAADIYKMVFNKASKAFNRDMPDDIKLKSAFPIPEPATMLLLGIGLIGLSGIRNRIKKQERTF